jgi:hypothetical protein
MLQANRGNCIEVAFKGCSGQHVAHIIPAVTHVRLQATAAGVHAGVELASATGGRMHLRFCSAIRPEGVDGI